MSQFVTEAFVQQFSANVMHLSQQQDSRFQSKVRNETQKGQSQFFDRVGLVAAVKKSGRHSSTPQLDTPQSRRMVSMDDYEWADLVDAQDKIRMLIDPTSEYAVAASYAFGRSKDDVIIAASVGSAYGGQDGKTPVAHPNSQKYAANDGTDFTNMTIDTLRSVKQIMDENEVIGKRYIACAASQIQSLLGQTQVTSSDYNSVKALVSGELNSFMGFEFVRTQRLSTVAAGVSADPTSGAVGSGSSVQGFRSCFAWAEKGLLLSTGEDVTSRMTERADKAYSMQVYMRMSVGATRMEEVQVVEIICDEP